jgi:signal transduction histidine kinase/ligand-binding sensor domain-containing protein
LQRGFRQGCTGNTFTDMSRAFWHFCLLTAAFLTACGSSSAQRYPFANIGIEQGLVQSQVFAMTQDDAGHLWVGTFGGLSRYDGNSFRSYTVRDGLPANNVSALCNDKRGHIWIGTNRGLSCYDGRVFRNFNFTGADNPGGNEVRGLSASGDGDVWCIAGRDLYQIREGKIRYIPRPARLATALLATKSLIWFGSESGDQLYFRNAAGWDSLRMPVSMYVRNLRADSSGDLMVFGSAGLFRFKPGRNSWTQELSMDIDRDGHALSYARSADGSIWVSTNTRFFRYLRGERSYFTRRSGFTDLQIYQVFRDAEGNIWAGSNGDGLYRFSGAGFITVDEHMGLTGAQVSSITDDALGTTYFGSYDGGFYSYQDGQATLIPFLPKFPEVPVTSLERFASAIWIGTQEAGIWRYDYRTKTMRPFQPERLRGTVTCMNAKSGKLAVALGKSLVLIDEDSVNVVGGLTQDIEAITAIGKDSLIVATNDGLELFTDGIMHPFPTGSVADSGQIVCMDYRQGWLWMGTTDNGVIAWNMNSGGLRHIGKAEGLRSDFIYNIYAATDSTIWVGTGYGICRIGLSGTRTSVTFYGHNAGLMGMESNRNARYPLPDGRIWFGTTSGALLYQPGGIFARTAPLSLQLQSVELYGDAIRDTSWYDASSAWYGVPQGLHLPWRQNSLSFSFSAISLSGSESLRYRYRLDGLNAPWSEWSPNNNVTFSALPPGKYALLVQCSIDGSTPLRADLRYDFEIITPFYKSNLFRLLVVLGCILLGIIIQYIVAKRRQAREHMIENLRREEQEKVRQRTAEDFHDELGNKLTRINILTNVLRSKIGSGGEDAVRIIDQIQDNTGQLYSGTRDILWSLQPANDSLYSLLERVRELGLDLFADTEVQFHMEAPDPAWRDRILPMDISRNLIMIFKEAFNNALKYAEASSMLVTTDVSTALLSISICDDGKGFDAEILAKGQGLGNMRNRARRMGTTLDVKTAPGKGTCLAMSIKIPSNKG